MKILQTSSLTNLPYGFCFSIAHLSHQATHNYAVDKNSKPKENNAKMNAGNKNPAVEPLLNCMLAQKSMKAERFYTPFNEKNNAIPHYIIPDELSGHPHAGHMENNIRSSSHTPTSKKRPRPLLQEEPPLQYMVAQQTVEDIMYLTSRSINNEYATKVSLWYFHQVKLTVLYRYSPTT